MANYRPVTKELTGSAVGSGVTIAVNLETSAWQMALLKGTAVSPTGKILGSGSILVWESTNPTTANPDHTTFARASGEYAVTVKAGVAIKARYYSA